MEERYTTYTSPAGQPQVGEYYDRGEPAQPQGRTAVRLSGVGDQMMRPLPRLLAGAALGVGGLLTLLSELNKGPKGHHSRLGRYGRMALGAGATYYGALWGMQALQDMPGVDI